MSAVAFPVHPAVAQCLSGFTPKDFGACQSAGEVVQQVVQTLSDSQSQQKLMWITRAASKLEGQPGAENKLSPLNVL